MAKGKRILYETVSKLDVIIEVRDSRAPASTSSPLIKSLSKIKPVIHVLSRKDLADTEKLNLWLANLKNTFSADLRNNKNVSPVLKAVLKFKPSHREVRTAVVGIPNVGKSLLLNSLISKSNAKVGNLPGVTKSVNFYRGDNILVVDSPGILDFHDSEDSHLILSWLNLVKAEVVGGFENAALKLVEFLCVKNFSNIIPVETENKTPYEILELIGKKYGCLISGGRIDFELSGRKFIEAFSSGRLGKICLELPNEEKIIDFNKNHEAADIV